MLSRYHYCLFFLTLTLNKNLNGDFINEARRALNLFRMHKSSSTYDVKININFVTVSYGGSPTYPGLCGKHKYNHCNCCQFEFNEYQLPGCKYIEGDLFL